MKNAIGKEGLSFFTDFIELNINIMPIKSNLSGNNK